MLRKLRFVTPELFTAVLLLACWIFVDARLQFVSLACVLLLLLRRIDEMRESSSYTALICRLRETQAELVRLSQFDRLTCLLNRDALITKLQSRLESEQSADRSFTIFFFDFDRFKVVNDSLGHGVGDQLLRLISDRLQSFVESESRTKSDIELVARLGGDEFVLVSRTCEDSAARSLAESLMLFLALPYTVGDSKLSASASLGVVVNQGQYTDAIEMLRDADVAMYEAKKSGLGSYRLFDLPMRARVQRRQRLEADLAQAIERSELRLVYQPIVCLRTGELSSVEALMRWLHPEEGAISPSEFIPIAEECGLIHRLCDWAVYEGCCQLLRWQQDIKIEPSYSFSLNLSPKQFCDSTLAHRIHQTIQSCGVNPQAIVFELTESVLMSEPDTALKILQTIKGYGSRIALDDFGTGHSSLATLHRFPVDILKFDRSFTRNIDKDRSLASMVHSIAVLAHNLGISTVAEGIETPEQFLTVRELGCDFAQGYLIAKPLAAAEFAEFAWRREPKVPTHVGGEIFSGSWDQSIKMIDFSTFAPQMGSGIDIPISR